jgi:amino acid transporter
MDSETATETSSLLAPGSLLSRPHSRKSSSSTSPRPFIRSLTCLNGIALVVGIQIGSGIFSTPGAVMNGAESSLLALIIWLLAGFLAWTGAASFVELGSNLPLNGGIQEYLRHTYGDVYDFLAAWSYFILVKPCSTAMISLIVAEYLYRAFDSQIEPSFWDLKGIAIVTIVATTALNVSVNFFISPTFCKLYRSAPHVPYKFHPFLGDLASLLLWRVGANFL